MENKTNKFDYIELTRVAISSSRDVVISERLKGGFTIGQQVITKDVNGEEKEIFLRNAIPLEDITGLECLRNALDNVLKMYNTKEDNKNTEDDVWN